MDAAVEKLLCLCESCTEKLFAQQWTTPLVEQQEHEGLLATVNASGLAVYLRI